MIAENQVKEIPPVPMLTKLSMLDVSKNRLASLPPSIAALGALHTLHAQHNHLTSLPDLNPLTQLAVLDLRENKLSSIATLPASPRLAKVLVSFNRLVSLYAKWPSLIQSCLQ